MNWVSALRDELDTGHSAVLVTLAAVEGSSPRDAGATMVVTQNTLTGSIGGGTLEYQAIQDARALLTTNTTGQSQQNIALGPSLGQCCGGSVTVVLDKFSSSDRPFIERICAEIKAGKTIVCRSLGEEKVITCFTPHDDLMLNKVMLNALKPGQTCLTTDKGIQKLWHHMGEGLTPLMLFGAGHVGHAIAHAIAPLPFAVTWIDNRTDALPKTGPGLHIHRQPSLSPAEDVGPTTNHHWILVMTHSHALDFEICRRALLYGPPPYLGLIGSKTKRARFLSQLKQQGLPNSALERLTCPIGLTGLTDKRPECIAASVVADLLIRREAAQTLQTVYEGVA